MNQDCVDFDLLKYDPFYSAYCVDVTAPASILNLLIRHRCVLDAELLGMTGVLRVWLRPFYADDDTSARRWYDALFLIALDAADGRVWTAFEGCVDLLDMRGVME